MLEVREVSDMFFRQEAGNMHVDGYEFGRIVIDAEAYEKDVVIAGGRVHANWWRREGHRLRIEDMDVLFDAEPTVIVIGCGAQGVMRVSDEVRRVVDEKKIRLEAMDTGEAVGRFNELAAGGEEIAAGFHLTC